MKIGRDAMLNLKLTGPDGNEIIVVADAQKSGILNLDVSAVMLDGNSKQ